MERISTHSAREDGDKASIWAWSAAISISTHSAREDGDCISTHIILIPIISTHSAREDGDL